MRKPRTRTAKVVKATKKFQKTGPFDWDKSSSEIQRDKFETQRKAAEERAAAPQSHLDSVDRLVSGLLKGYGPASMGVALTATFDLSALRAAQGALSADYEELATLYVEKRLTPLPLENRYRRLGYRNACSDDRQRDAMEWDFEEMGRPDLDFAIFGRYVCIALAKNFGWFIGSDKETIGIKKISAAEDPMASPAQLKSLAKKDPLQALAHGNCPVDLWKSLAAKHPFEAMESIARPLLLLENPNLWNELELANSSAWIGQYLRKLSERDQELFGIDCAEHVLSVYEQVHPGDARVRQANLRHRLYVLGGASKAELRAGFDLAQAAQNAARIGRAKQAAAAANTQLASFASQCAAEAMGSSVHYGLDHSAYLAERQWQWHRLLQYLRGEVSGYSKRSRTASR